MSDLPKEIERKYLLSALPPEAEAMPPIHIEQGWIPGKVLRERLRRATYPDGRVRCIRTIKIGPIEERIELEEETTAAIFQVMWPLTAQKRIRKHRHVIRDGEFEWEIDVFLDRDLVLAEVELEHRDIRPPVPAWMQPFLVREVTGDEQYQNSRMARPDPDVPVYLL